ncbi:hypothetical protein [Teredinibacter sp. KSP-S5-2]|uniref:hypothetical protein n=1 Tax=Teredinibacter sp. KSP-S5-2 TaxID=3034506 RepID=UPI002934E9D4|nr:hypothetical protein [Teredinibacter sp. KSP-S5-2]WNO10733.1 hypothetical protein P5V12_06045 [Teredinibacter sp. KSP-S5-2]
MKIRSILFFSTLAISSFCHAEYNQWELANANTFQQDDWSCGVHSSYRLLASHNQTEDYNEMRNVIGAYEFDINFTYRIGTRVSEEVCDGWKKILLIKECTAWKTVEKLVEETKQGSLTLNTGGGLPDKILVEKLRSYYRESFNVADRKSFTDLKNMIDAGKTPMALIHNWTDTYKLDSKAALNTIGVFFGPEAYLISGATIHAPHYHWIIINGYDENNVYYNDTYDDQIHSMSITEFNKQWEWKNGEISSIIKTHLNFYENMYPNTLLWIDEPLSLAQNIPFRGVMVAINSLILSN